MRIALATTNEGKAQEMQKYFTALKNITWQSLADFPTTEEPEETGTTFEANALLKAQYYGEKLSIPVVAEDSGLILEVFPEKFGLKTRRELNAKDDHDWLDQFLALIRDEDNRRASFYSAMAYFDPATGETQVVLGESAGEMVDFPQAPIEPGIPVSSIFLPDGADEVLAALPKKDRMMVSHRGRSAEKLLEFLALKTGL